MAIHVRSQAPASHAPPVIALEQVTKVFAARGKRETAALEATNLVIEPGEFVSLLGPSGCGKSTLLRLVASLINPTSGSVLVNGKDAAQARRDRDYSMVFQQPGLLEWRSVEGNVELPLQVLGAGKKGRRQRAGEMLALVGLSDFAQHYPSQLSGGMQQRVAIARALSTQPKLLLMDEPLGALDEMNREYLQGELLRIWDASKTTVLFVTHSVSEAVFLSTRVCVMSARPGKIEAEIDIDLPYPRPADLRSDAHYFSKVAEARAALHAAGADKPVNE